MPDDVEEVTHPEGTSSSDATSSSPILIVVMGVSGCGKSTLGSGIAEALHLPFIDADDIHPPANRAKMTAGIPLTDADRAPWLVKVRDEAGRIVREGLAPHKDGSEEDKQAGRGRGVVVACSALKKSYREVLRGDRVLLEEDHQTHEENDHPHPAPPALRTFFVHPHGARDLLLERMHKRKDHFMKASMLDSQLQTLEDPLEGEGGKPEAGTIRIPLELSMEEQVKMTVDKLKEFNVETAA
ncbi:carbohydrate kinase [Stereum hirsutum FP-91666 SS1]|uniref:carbohydrate kinase n=1 Tax=Stereum hirsutum (strain FP-91666) TaxID=721885 RepID=UPI00044497EE|nr:carbohydrate kinase [Stereum hirsutum FP-91666 SS1]EIM83820.1 carbohydrate kinase [Stereum hirsutum FP-91666 SS1]